jgi:hypothetical protein
MKRAAAWSVALLSILASLAVPLLAIDHPGSPHILVKPDGTLDMDICGNCHEEDNKTLSRSKLETCTLCHDETPHSGAIEHQRASAAAVAKRLPSGEGALKFPLTEEGTIYCGTCHLFHVPALGEKPPLAVGWFPAPEGLAGKVKESLEAKLGSVAEKYGKESADAHFATDPVLRLRLPIADRALCLHCHGDLVK